MEKTSATDAFWEAAKAADASLGDDYWVRRIGGNRETVDIILDLVLRGEKRGTFGVKLLQERQPEITPNLGGYAILMDMDDAPQAIVKTTQLTPVPYKDITEDHLVVEGPGARKLDVWQDIHWPYWTSLLAKHDLKPSQDMVIVVEHFDRVYPQ